MILSQTKMVHRFPSAVFFTFVALIHVRYKSILMYPDSLIHMSDLLPDIAFKVYVIQHRTFTRLNSKTIQTFIGGGEYSDQFPIAGSKT